VLVIKALIASDRVLRCGTSCINFQRSSMLCAARLPRRSPQ